VRGDRGAFAALELTILSAFVIVMLLLVAGFGRVERGRELIDQAAAAAARAGSLATSPADAQVAARHAASATLADGGMSCRTLQLRLDTGQWYPGGRVVAHVACRTDLSDLVVAGLPGAIELHSDASSVLETYRPAAGPP